MTSCYQHIVVNSTRDSVPIAIAYPFFSFFFVYFFLRDNSGSDPEVHCTLINPSMYSIILFFDLKHPNIEKY